MADSDDAATSPVLYRQRRRRSSGDGDEALLDAMLVELGIPTSDSKKKKTTPTTDDIIELITPPRPLRRALTREETKSEEDVHGHAFDDSILDLTTPTPPSSGKRRRSPRVGRQSIVNLLSPENSDHTESDDNLDERQANGDLIRGEASPTRRRIVLDNTDERQDDDPNDDIPLERRIRLRTNQPPVQRHNENDEDGRRWRHEEEEREGEQLLREINETQTRIHVPRPTNTMPSVRMENIASVLRRHEATFPSRQSSTEELQSDEEPPPKKRGRQSKKNAAAPPKPTKQVVLAAVAIEKRLFASPIGTAIKTALESNTYNNKTVPFVLERAFESDLNVIQWERRGDSGREDSSRYVIAMHYPADSFLDLLADHGYDALVSAAKWLTDESLCIGRQRTIAWGSLVLIVEGMDRALIARSKKAKAKRTNTTQSNTSSPITFSELHELTFRLFMDTSVHTKFTCDTEDTATYVALLTREIIVAAVKQSSQEEFLDSVPRVHSFRVLPGSGSTLNPFANTWVRMLQMIPGVSEDRAQIILDHFPTFQSLLRAYNDPRRSQEEKEELLADKLHDSRFESALSRRIFRAFGGWNENDSL